MTTLNAVWPLFGLTLKTPRLELRPILDQDVPAAVAAARSGIHQPGRNPFSTPWTEFPAEELGPNMARWYWRCRAECTPESWTLLLGIWHDGGFIGCQDVGAKDFAVLRTVSTGSYEPKGITRKAWGTKVESVQHVRLTPDTFKRPDWTPPGRGPRSSSEVPQGHLSESAMAGSAAGAGFAAPQSFSVA